MEDAPRPPVRADVLNSVFIKVGQVKVQSGTHPFQETICGRLFAITSSAYNDTSAQPQTSQWGQPAEIPVEVRVL